MVEDRVTDGKRIGQLLASELTGLTRPPLDRVDVVDADPDATPTPDGAFAYGVTLDDERVAAVFVHDAFARVRLERAPSVDVGSALESAAEDGDLSGLSVISDVAEDREFGEEAGDCGSGEEAEDRESGEEAGDCESGGTRSGPAIVVDRGGAVKNAVDLLGATIETAR